MQPARKTLARAAAPAPTPPVQVLAPPSRVQCAGAFRVSSPQDAAEKEAEATARRIVRMPEPLAGPATPVAGMAMRSPWLARFSESIVQRAPLAQPNVSSNVAAEIDAAQSSGSPLPPSVRRFMEPRFGADFSGVRIHTGERAAKLNRQLSARAFTVGNQIFFGKERYQPEHPQGRELIAHELTHTVQQGAVSQGAGIRRSAEVAVHEHSSGEVQRGWLPDPRDFIAGKAAAIPGFTLFTVVIGFNPITNARVDRSAGNLLKGAIELIPGGSLITEALDNHGIFARVSAWAQAQFEAIRNIGSDIWNEIEQFIKDFDITDLGNLDGLWERGKRIVTVPIERMMAFARNLKDGIVQLVKDAILKPIGAFARTTRGYPLLCSILGKDPITGEPAPQDAESLMGAFMSFIGEQELWETMKKANAIARTFAWFKGAVAALKGFVAEIPGLFVAAFKSLELLDIVLVPRAFLKLAKVFGGFAGRFISWGANAVWNLLEIVFDVVKPGIMGYIKRTGAALKGILRNPLPFVGNLVKAAKQGFLDFAARIGGHLKAGLIDWLTGSLSGVYIPKALTLPELGKLAMSVLGITWAQIRGKIVKVLGPSGETIMQGLETGFEVVVALVKGGPAAAWELIKEKLSDLKDTVVSGIIGFVTETIVKKAIPKLVAMFIPGAGFVSAILSIYDTVMVFVQKIAKIIQVVTAFIDSIVAIAGGAIGAAAKRVEGILAGLLSLAISFLAGFLGLGKITDKIVAIVAKVRAAVDKAIDTAIGWIVGKAKSLFGKLFGKGDKAGKDGGDVRDAAGVSLQRVLGSEATDAEAERAARQVEGELRPQGLKKVYLGPADAEGNRPFFAEASPPKRIRVLARQRVIVGIQATVTVTGAPALVGLGGAKFAKFDKERAEAMGGPGRAALLPEVPQPPGTRARKGSQPASGLVIEPEQNASKLEIIAWNTRAPEKGHNVSHAERQFINWFEARDYPWKQRVLSVEVQVYGRDICELCAADINILKSKYTHIAFNWRRADSSGKQGKEEKRQVTT